jgi:DNA-binding transcriptional LysR family regulator
MDRLRRMAIFASVVERRSMRAAAIELGLTASAVSQHLRQLEHELGLTLLHRTTRKLTLTPAGEQYYEGCAEVVRAARLADERLAELRDELVGELRLAAPAGFVGPVLTEPLAPLLAAHPRLRLTLLLHDENIDLVEHRVDLAVRVGVPDDSGHVARPLAQWRALLCAAPRYLASRPPIDSPDALASQHWLLHGRDGSTIELSGPDGQTHQLRIEARLKANNMPALRDFTLAGLGIALLAEPEVRGLLAQNRLVQVLPAWSTTPITIHAVTPRRSAQPAKVRAAIAAFRQYLAQ